MYLNIEAGLEGQLANVFWRELSRHLHQHTLSLSNINPLNDLPYIFFCHQPHLHPPVHRVDHDVIVPAGGISFGANTQSVQSMRHAILDEGLCDALAVAIGSMESGSILP